MAYIYLDPNVRDLLVSDSTDVMLKDSKVIVQSVWRLITTEEGEIPNFRVYGLSIKKYSQYPMTPETINGIYDYVKGRISVFEERAEVIKADVDANIEQQIIFYNFYLRIRTTGTVIKLPTWTVSVGAA